MKRILIIDDYSCKEELDKFVEDHKEDVSIFRYADKVGVHLSSIAVLLEKQFELNKLLVLVGTEQVVKLQLKEIMFMELTPKGETLCHICADKYEKHRLPNSPGYYAERINSPLLVSVADELLVNLYCIKSLHVSKNEILFENLTRINTNQQGMAAIQSRMQELFNN
jgi:hypothetical protein